MNYNEALKYIHSLNKFGIKPGLERITALLNELGNPEKDLNFIHIAGTNGKGSTAAMLSNIFMADGKKTGLFISPYIIDFRERIQINGEYIKQKELAELTEKISISAKKVNTLLKDDITEFEFITALAFCYFKDKGCDIVVLEVGLGGRLDSTNVIASPVASVITKVDLDHTGILGETISEIAKEKSGIIKTNSLVVTSSNQNAVALKIIKQTAKDKNSDFVLADVNEINNLKTNIHCTEFEIDDMYITLNLAGEHQIENAVTVIKTCLALKVNKQAITKGIKNTTFPARLEIISKNPLTILDGAHNKNGADALVSFLQSFNIKPVCVVGMMRDKDSQSVISKIASLSKAVITVEVKNNPRTASKEELLDIAKDFCKEVMTAENYDNAIALALEQSKSLSAPIVICGSLYLASDIRNIALKYLK